MEKSTKTKKNTEENKYFYTAYVVYGKENPSEKTIEEMGKLRETLERFLNGKTLNEQDELVKQSEDLGFYKTKSKKKNKDENIK